jgi:hypothetical protein
MVSTKLPIPQYTISASVWRRSRVSLRRVDIVNRGRKLMLLAGAFNIRSAAPLLISRLDVWLRRRKSSTRSEGAQLGRRCSKQANTWTGLKISSTRWKKIRIISECAVLIFVDMLRAATAEAGAPSDVLVTGSRTVHERYSRSPLCEHQESTALMMYHTHCSVEK